MKIIKFYTNCLDEHILDTIRKALHLNQTSNSYSYFNKKTTFRITK